MLAKLLYASPAWRRFATTADKQRIEAFVRPCVRLGLYGAEDPTPVRLAENADEGLCRRIGYSEHHVLQQSLPISIITATVFGVDGITSF